MRYLEISGISITRYFTENFDAAIVGETKADSRHDDGATINR